MAQASDTEIVNIGETSIIREARTAPIHIMYKNQRYTRSSGLNRDMGGEDAIMKLAKKEENRTTSQIIVVQVSDDVWYLYKRVD